MNKIAIELLADTLSEIIGHSVESQIKLEAMERALKLTNPLLHEVYLGQLEDLKTQRGYPVESGSNRKSEIKAS